MWRMYRLSQYYSWTPTKRTSSGRPYLFCIQHVAHSSVRTYIQIVSAFSNFSSSFSTSFFKFLFFPLFFLALPLTFSYRSMGKVLRLNWVITGKCFWGSLSMETNLALTHFESVFTHARTFEYKRKMAVTPKICCSVKVPWLCWLKQLTNCYFRGKNAES